MYCASSKEGTVWCSVCDPVAQCILPNTKPTPGPQQICWKLASWTPAKPICWHILTHWSDGKWGGSGQKSNFSYRENDDKPPGFVRHICNQTLLVADQNQYALIFTSTWFDYVWLHKGSAPDIWYHSQALTHPQNFALLPFDFQTQSFASVRGLFHHRSRRRARSIPPQGHGGDLGAQSTS